MPEHESRSSRALELSELVTSIVEGLPAQQQRLDEDYLRRLSVAGAALQQLGELVPESIKRLMAPSRWVLSQTDVEVSVQLTRGREQALQLLTRPLNLAYARKYAHADFSESKLRITVGSVAPELRKPGAPPE
ncbi:MAG: hypothetical protein AAF560_10145 [Acidobacteriota bacterium]